MRQFTLSRVVLLLFSCIAMSGQLQANLAGHWVFDEGSGTNIVDISGQGNHGTLINPKADTWTNGMNGGALHFNGTTGSDSTYVFIPDAASLHITNAISFSAWVRCENITRDSPILAKEGDGNLSYWFGELGAAHFGVLLDTDGNQPWTIQDRDQGVVSQGQWMHLASTWDGTTIRHYLNGALLAQTAAFSGTLHAGSGPLVIGSNFPYNNTAYQGALDDVRVYDHALSTSEVRTLAGLMRQKVGYWSFEEGGGTVIADQSGHGNHGTLVNAKTNTWTAGLGGSALYFDGTTGLNSTYVAIPDSPSLRIPAEISFSAWVRCDDITLDAPVLAKEGDAKLSYWFGTFGKNVEGAGPGNFGVLLDGDGNQPWTTYDRNQGAVPEGAWVHLASTWDGATIRHYLNGEALPETGTFAGPTYSSDAFLAIGVNSVYNYTAFKGVIDEVQLYNYALSPEEVSALYLAFGFRITSVKREGDDLRLAWACAPGRSYVVQTNDSSTGGAYIGAFADLTAPIAVPLGLGATTTNYLHRGTATNAGGYFYRVKLLP